jgi:hypothetical protein
MLAYFTARGAIRTRDFLLTKEVLYP